MQTRRFTLILVLTLIAGFFLTSVQAQSTYWIATEGATWTEPWIQINVPSSPSMLHDDVLKAIGIWNRALSWFGSQYYPMAVSYQFIASSNGGGVTIQAADLQTLQTYCSTQNTITGCTHLKWDSDTGAIIAAQTYLLASEFSGSNPNHLYAVLYALGNVMALLGFPAPCPFQDLMCENTPSVYPSTLDLYAAHLLATGKLITKITLPSNIPYQQAPIVPVPEFNATSILLLVLAATSALILRKRFCKP